MLRLGWFSSGRGPGSRNLLKAVMDKKLSGELDIEIAFVFCNWDNTEEDNPKRDQRDIFFEMVKGYSIPLVTVSWKKFKPDLRRNDQDAWRDEYGKLLREKTGQYGFDLGILAGYMMWMDNETCRAYDMLNLHPALPDGPKGTWQEVIWQLIAEDADYQGSMLHLCTEEWDRGAPLTYCSFQIKGPEYDGLWRDLEEKLKTRCLDDIKSEEGENNPLFRKIREDGAKRELPLIVATIKEFADGHVKIDCKRLLVDGKPIDGPYDLSAKVDASLE